MTRPVDPSIDVGRGEDAPRGGGVAPERFREALARWASGVAVVAVRDEERVYATTVTALASVSVEPPLVVTSLGGGAQVLPFLEVGRPFAVSVLAEEQQRLATVFADAFAVGPSPFPADGPPLLPGALVGLTCRVHAVHPSADHRLVVGLVEDVALESAGGGRPLLYWERSYRGLGEEA